MSGTNPIPRVRPSRVLITMVIIGSFLTSCGGGGDDGVALADTATCSVVRSEFGPLGPDTRLGETMDEATVRETMARDNVAEFLEITATGPWRDAWDLAGQRLGDGIHVSLSWIDVDGELRDLFEDGDAYEFSDLRVSRSFQGKIEHTVEPIYLPVPDDGRVVAETPTCVITSIHVGDQSAASLTDLVDELPTGS